MLAADTTRSKVRWDRAAGGESGVVQETGKKFTGSKAVLKLRFEPPAVEEEEPRQEGDA